MGAGMRTSLWLLLLVVATWAGMAAFEGREHTPVAEAAIGETVEGFGINATGNSFNLGWTTGNLGDQFQEGEWIAYQVRFGDVQSSFPGLTNLEIEISYDFFRSGGGVDATFIDLIRSIQVCPGTASTDGARTGTNAYPNAGGTAFPLTNQTQINAAQNNPNEYFWSDCFALNLPTSLVNRGPGGVALDPEDAEASFIVTAADLTGAGLSSSEDDFTIYFQLHLSRTFIWDNSLQDEYDQSPTDLWGGYVYSDSDFASIDRLGSGFVPGSSGHVQLVAVGGSVNVGNKEVSIPLPPEPDVDICGLKWLDSDFDGTQDVGESTLSGWRIHAFTTVEGIDVSFSTLTDGSGNYCFSDLTDGVWLVKEASDREVPVQTDYVETFPKSGTTVGQCIDATVSPPPTGVAPVGYSCNLTGPQGGLNFGNAVPEARISIDPPSGINEVGVPHALTCTIEVVTSGSGFQPAADGTLCELRIVSGPGTLSGGDGPTTGFDESCTTSGGTGECQVDLTSNDDGETVVEACTTVTVLGTTLPQECTDGTSGNSEEAEKFWVDASVSIAADDTNAVNESHTFTITVTTASSAGVTIDYIDITPTGDTSFITSDTCVDNQSSTATSCTVTVNSAAAGSASIGADVEVGFSAGSETAVVNRSTDGTTTPSGLSNSDEATKTWVNAKISLTPATGTNPVGTNHELTCTVQVNNGTGWANAPDGTVCDADIDSGPGSFVGGDSCTVSGGDGNCVITITSNTAGTTTVSACTAEDNTGGVVVGGVTLFRCTDGQSVESGQSNSGPATKTWVAVRISLTPDGTNFIHDSHDFTCKVELDSGSGFAGVAGVTCEGAIDSGPGAFVGGDDDCVTDSNGECTLSITSTSTGVTVVSASAQVPVNGDTVTVSTDGANGNSDPAEKTWIAASVRFTKTFEPGALTPLGQACFTLSRVPAPPPPLSSDSATQCGTGSPLTFQWDDLVAGAYTIEETTVPAGYSKLANITFTVAEDCTGVVGTCVQASSSPTPFNLGTFSNDLAPGDLRVRKLLGPTGGAWNGPDVTIYICLNGGTPPGSSSTELPLTSCDSAGEAEAVVTLTAADSSEDVTGLEEGWYTLCEFPVPAGYSVDDQCQTIEVRSGEAASANVVTFTNTPSGEGCTPGFWKTHPQLWDGVGGNDVTNTVQTTDLFNATFGVTSAQSGLADTVTLLDATNLNGGGKKALARHAAAALASADSGIDYPYSVAQVRALYRDGVGADAGPETVQSALAKLQAANELGCPLN